MLSGTYPVLLFIYSSDTILQSLREYVDFSPQTSLINISTCVVFIAEITARAFIIADSNKRRTLSRADIAKALSKSDQFDFLIDIVPRDELLFPGTGGPSRRGSGLSGSRKDHVRMHALSSVFFSFFSQTKGSSLTMHLYRGR
jgi:hypothetical protein